MTFLWPVDGRNWKAIGTGYRFGPRRVVWHITASYASLGAWLRWAWGAKQQVAPYHVVYDWLNDDVAQLVSLDQPVAGLRNNDSGGIETNRRSAIQVSIIASPSQVASFTPEVLDRIGVRLLAPILGHFSEIDPWQFPSRGFMDFYHRTQGRLDRDEWKTFHGQCGHQHVPFQAPTYHWDPTWAQWAMVRITQAAVAHQGEPMPRPREQKSVVDIVSPPRNQTFAPYLELSADRSTATAAVDVTEPQPGRIIVTADGGVRGEPFHGSVPGVIPGGWFNPGGVTEDEWAVGAAFTPDGGGYWIASQVGGVANFGNAPAAIASYYDPSRRGTDREVAGVYSVGNEAFLVFDDPELPVAPLH